MAFADPQVLTDGVDQILSLPRTALGLDKGQFRTADSLYKLRIEHTYAQKNARHLVRLDSTKVVPDPIVPAQNKQTSLAVYMVVDAPSFGFTTEETLTLVNTIPYWVIAAGAQWIGGEV
jgi:hypothetical protein